MPQRDGAPAIAKTDMIDPHWYVDPYFFFRNTTLFDTYERGKYTVYVGEYACNRGVGGGNMLGALSEAAFIGGMERNGDLVTMASYAPLFENRHDRNWATNLIWIDSDRVMGRSSYYVQKMAAENRPDFNVKSNITMHEAPPESVGKGHLGLGASLASVEFKDVKVIQNGVTDLLGDMILSKEDHMLPEKVYEGDYTLEFKVRKTEGEQGFQIFLGMSEDGKTGYRYNIGMWSSNDRAELIRLERGKDKGVLSEHSGKKIEKDRWYEVKVVVSSMKNECYLDNELVLSSVPQAMPLQFVASGYDEEKGELVIKVVNGADAAYLTTIQVKGSKNIAEEGRVISLTATDGSEENSFEEPRKIYPEEITYKGFGPEFDYEFPPFSYTILRVKAEKQ